ncbi:MAG TPA: hypothetical protein VKU02_06720, partial [Gemmataceae bacterium]|nr:hypothetical protein [Gemmataceae bacterium]
MYPSAVPSPAVGQPPPPPPTGYEHAATFGINRRVVSWLTPVALLLVLILMYFPWTGVYPGGYAVYTQNALQMIWGGFSVDATGDKVLGMAKGIEGAMNANWMMAIYLLFLLGALFLGVLPLVQAHTPYPLPHSLQ